MTEPLSNKIYHDIPLNQTKFSYKFICESCQKSSDTRNLSDRLDFSEAKEEEKDCHYCYEEHIKCSAETLFNGRPSCKECKKKNSISFMSPKITGQKIMITQVVKTNPLILSPPASSYKKSSYHHRAISMFPSMINNQCINYQGAQSTNANHTKTLSLKNDSGSNTKTKLKLNPQYQMDDCSDYSSDSGISLPQPFLSARNSIAHKIFFENNSPSKLNRDDENDKNMVMDFDSNTKTSKSKKLDIAVMPTNTINGLNISTSSTISTFSGGEVNELKKIEKPLLAGIIKFRDPKVVNILYNILSGDMIALKNNIIYLASKDTLGSKYFHFKCDNKAPIILALILKSGAIFGGLTYKPLDSKITEVKDEMAGIFYSVENKEIILHKVSGDVVIYKKTGVVFGNPIMLEINFDILNNIIWSIDLKENSPSNLKKTPEWKKYIRDVMVLKL